MAAGMEGVVEIHAGEHGEDVSLQERDEKFERQHCQRHDERQRRDHSPETGAPQKQDEGATAGRAIRESALEAVAQGVKTADLGGHATTTEFTDDVIARTRTKLEVWSTL